MTHLWRAGVGAVCAYEAFACFTGRVPTVSRLAAAHRFGPFVSGVVLGGLAVHFALGEET